MLNIANYFVLSNKFIIFASTQLNSIIMVGFLAYLILFGFVIVVFVAYYSFVGIIKIIRHFIDKKHDERVMKEYHERLKKEELEINERHKRWHEYYLRELGVIE